MPTISRFFGVVISMYHDDHAPPHFHARYSGAKASIAINTRAIIDGSLPPRALGLVAEWASKHQDELMANWERARAHLPLLPIAPLE
jgi:hypothetical protein